MRSKFTGEALEIILSKEDLAHGAETEAGRFNILHSTVTDSEGAEIGSLRLQRVVMYNHGRTVKKAGGLYWASYENNQFSILIKSRVYKRLAESGKIYSEMPNCKPVEIKVED